MAIHKFLKRATPEEQRDGPALKVIRAAGIHCPRESRKFAEIYARFLAHLKALPEARGQTDAARHEERCW